MMILPYRNISYKSWAPTILLNPFHYTATKSPFTSLEITMGQDKIYGWSTQAQKPENLTHSLPISTNLLLNLFETKKVLNVSPLLFSILYCSCFFRVLNFLWQSYICCKTQKQIILGVPLSQLSTFYKSANQGLKQQISYIFLHNA
jgi:hypothetical protein